MQASHGIVQTHAVTCPHQSRSTKTPKLLPAILLQYTYIYKIKNALRFPRLDQAWSCNYYCFQHKILIGSSYPSLI